eukprot:7385259-Prymnesium_polylepis.2
MEVRRHAMRQISAERGGPLGNVGGKPVAHPPRVQQAAAEHIARRAVPMLGARDAFTAEHAQLRNLQISHLASV